MVYIRSAKEQEEFEIFEQFFCEEWDVFSELNFRYKESYSDYLLLEDEYRSIVFETVNRWIRLTFSSKNQGFTCSIKSIYNGELQDFFSLVDYLRLESLVEDEQEALKLLKLQSYQGETFKERLESFASYLKKIFLMQPMYNILLGKEWKIYPADLSPYK